MRLLQTIILIIFTILAVAFAISNSSPVTLNYQFGQITTPLSLALVASLLLGFFLGFLACLKPLIFNKYKIVKLNKDIDAANKEIANLRAIPIKDEH